MRIWAPLLGCASLAVVLSGCAIPWQQHELDYAESIPTGVSMAWMQSDELWIVPQKRQRIREVMDEGGRSLKWSKAGEYVKVQHPSHTVRIRMDDGWKTLRLSTEGRR